MDCAYNIITANFSGGKTHATTARVYQWSRGIELCITGADNLPQTFKAHFSVQKKGGVATTIVGIDERVDVPNVLFTIGKDIHVWLGASETEDDAEILYTVDIPVAPAPMPEYYDAEDTGVFDAVVEQVSGYAATATAAANSAGASATAAVGSASAAAASASSAAGSAGAAEQARADAVTAKGQAETAAQTATEKALQTAQNASQAALDAGRAESAAERAESAESGAGTAKTAAEAAAQSAAASAATADEKASLAGQSATAAAGSASAAAQSAASIEGDVQIASQKASEAQTAAGQAVTAKDAAVTAQQGAETAATNAGQSASTATAKAAEAAQSAANTAQSKTDAEAAAARAEAAAASLTVDTALSDTSTNPVQNKVITGALTDVKSALDAVRYPSNIFNPEDISDEHGYIKDGNEFFSNESFRHSNYITVSPYGTYMHPCYPGTFGTSLVRVCHGYDANGTYVRFLGTLTGNNQYLVFTVPSNVVKIRVNVKYEDLTTFMLVDGNVYPDMYIPFEKVYLRDNVSFIHEQGVTVENINLFNNESADIIDGSVISGYGEIATQTGFCISGYIPIEPDVEYEVPIYVSKLGTAAKAVPIFNADKTYIQRVVGTYDDTTKRIKFTATNAAARYVRVNVAKRGDKALYVTPWHYYGIFMLTKAPFPSRYYSYGEKKVFDSEYYLPVEKENDYNALIGKTVLFYGDSICYGDDLDGWAGRIGQKNRMTWENMGISGATFFKNSIAGCIVEQPIPFDSPDYIILEGGTNDADRVGNSISDPKPSAFGSYDWTNWGTSDASAYYGFDITTFCGAFEYMLKRITTQYPGVKIGYIVAQKMGRTNDYRPTANNRRFFFETAMDICRKWGVTYINLWDGSTLNPSNPSMYNSEQQGDANYYYIDGQHLTAKGYDLITPQIEAWMKTL